MGLDMYLYAERYMSGYTDPDARDRLLAALPEWPGEPESFTVSAQVAYWRKANAIHGWFVNVLADGVDNCQRIDVCESDLRVLRQTCEYLLERRDPKEAVEKLPPCEGFYFGSKDIDEDYWKDLEDTVAQLNVILVWNEARKAESGRTYYSGVSYVYQASW